MEKLTLLNALINEESLIDTKEKCLYIPDVSSHPYRVYGLQIANLSNFTDKELKEILQKEETLTCYAMGHIPAPGTLSPNRMGFYSFETISANDSSVQPAEEIKEQYELFFTRYEESSSLSNLITEKEFIKNIMNNNNN